MAEQGPQAPRTLLRVAIGAGGSGLVLGLVIGSFSAAGIVDMTVAVTMLLAAWIIGTVAITASEPIWGLAPKLRWPVIIGTSVALAVFLGLIGLYQSNHLPISEKQSARLQVATVVPVRIPSTGKNIFNLQLDMRDQFRPSM
jgi:hypothetical protein